MWSFDVRQLPPPRTRDAQISDAIGRSGRGPEVEPAPQTLPQPEVQSAEWFTRVFRLEDRIRQGLTDERIDIWRPEGKRVLVTGTARDSAAVSALTARIQRDTDVARADLVAISVEGKRQRFALMVDLASD